MNILQIRGEFSDNGPGTQCLTISSELRKRGHNVILCASGGHLKEKIQNLKFCFFEIPEISFKKRNPLNILISIFKLKKLIEKQNIEIIHGHNAAVITIANIAGFLTGKKIKYFQSVRGVECRKNYFFRNWIYKLNKFSTLFAVSKFTKDTIQTFGVPSEKIVITYNGTDLTRFDIKKASTYRQKIREEFDIPKDALVIGIIGKQDGNKGHRNLIKIFSRLESEFKNLYILLIGEGKELNSNKKLAKDLNIDSRVIFAGLRFDVEMFHPAFDVFTLLSKKGFEMFPNVIVEAMTYAIPFVSVNTTGIPEMAESNEGIICECDNLSEIETAFRKLLTEKAQRIAMGTKGRETVIKTFNIEAVVDKIERAYKNA